MRLQSRLILSILLAFILIIPGVVFSQENSVTISGYVMDNNGAPVENAWVSFHDPLNNIGAGNQTLSDGSYTVLVPIGTYNLEVSSHNDDSFGRFFKQNVVITGDTVYNIVLSLRAEIVDPIVSPETIAQGKAGNVQFSMIDMSGSPVTGLVNSNFEIWLHDWSDPDGSEWWNTRIQNSYHIDLTNSITVSEIWGQPGNYQFNFILPDTFSSANSGAEIQIIYGEYNGWVGFHVASATAVELSGWVTNIDGVGLADIGVGLWNSETETGAWSNTDSSDFYSMLAEPGTYHLNAWPQSGDTGGFFLNGFTLTTDTVFNIILTPRAIFSEIELSPHSIRQGDVVSASFSITDENNVPLSGIPDSTYTIWLHNWQEDPSDNWWENPISNQYHQDISEVVNVVENVAGSYSFSFIIPSDMVVTSGWLDLEIRLGESGGMAGIQVASENSVVLSGIVVAEDGSVLPRAGVGLVDEVNNKEFFIETDSSGRYTLFVEPGVYTLMAKGGEDLSGYRRIGFSITSDTTWDIVLVQRIHMNIVESVPEPFNSTDTFTISLEVFDDNESLITGLLDSEFNIWIHNHNDPEDWRSNPIQNNYHQDLTNIITVTEISPGRYSFTFTIPDGIDIDQNMMSLNIHLVKYGGWVSQTETGLPIN